MLKLIIEDDEGKTTIVPLIRDEVTIGRKEGNTIRLTERNVSRRHARLTKRSGHVYIEDLESYNGIQVNGDRLGGRKVVALGDRIQIGDYVLGLRFEGEQPVAGVANAGPAEASQPAKVPEEPAKVPEEPPTTERVPLGEPHSAPTLPITSNGVRATPDSALSAARGAAVARGIRPQRDDSAARLVCVSRNFAGLEAALNGSSLVIGRTSDNDIVINHRSISRHHAKVIEESGRYTIMDMQSANGLRVNGEEYGKVELKRGDLVDLGHVRLRFVAPGETFNFEKDATIFDSIHEGESARGGIWIALAVLGLVVSGGIVWQVMRDGDDDVAGGLSWGAQQQDVAARESLDAKRAEPSPSAIAADGVRGGQPNLAGLLEKLSARAWDDALVICRNFRGTLVEESAIPCGRAKLEAAAKLVFDAGNAAYQTKNYPAALLEFKKIPQESAYFAALRETGVFEQTKTSYLSEEKARIKSALARGSCDEAKLKINALRELLPEVADIPGLARCRRSRRAKTGSARRRKAALSAKQEIGSRGAGVPTAQRRAKSARGAVSEAKIAAARKTREEAWKAYREGYYARAAKLSRKVLRTMPDQQAVSIIGASACYLKKIAEAKSAYRRLDPQRQRLLRRVCERVGVELD